MILAIEIDGMVYWSTNTPILFDGAVFTIELPTMFINIDLKRVDKFVGVRPDTGIVYKDRRAYD